MEMVIMNLITNSGEAKSAAMEAIGYAKTFKFDEAHVAIEASAASLSKAHKSQTTLIQSEASGDKVELSMLLIHAQDHLMNAITAKDLASEIVDLYQLIYNMSRK